MTPADLAGDAITRRPAAFCRICSFQPPDDLPDAPLTVGLLINKLTLREHRQAEYRDDVATAGEDWPDVVRRRLEEEVLAINGAEVEDEARADVRRVKAICVSRYGGFHSKSLKRVVAQFSLDSGNDFRDVDEMSLYEFVDLLQGAKEVSPKTEAPRKSSTRPKRSTKSAKQGRN